MMRGNYGFRRARILLTLCLWQAEAYSLVHPFLCHRTTTRGSALGSAEGLGILEDVEPVQVDAPQDIDVAALDTFQIKNLLLDLLPRMTGKTEEFRAVETYVNALEDRYTPVQTLDFLNLAISGDWQLLFSTNLSAGPRPNFRIREMFQSIEPRSLKGTLMNQVTWDHAEEGQIFDVSGTFTVKCSYEINQGSRMVLGLDDHVLELAKGSAVPKDVQGLVGLLHRGMPKEMFDPNDHAIDTTYVDGDLRIVRYAGSRFEGVRDIFIRRGSREINPL